MDSQIPKTSKFYKVYANLGMHMNPDVVKKEYQKYINTDDLNTKNLKKYFEILSSISFVLNKLLKYKIYFTEFYPNTKNIKNYEALEYHIHAYLEDIDILRNKVCWYAGMLKNDLKQLATNKEEIDTALKTFRQNMEPVFNDVIKHRHPHHHKGMKFLDPDLVNAHGLDVLLGIDGFFDEEALKKIKQKAGASFDKAKDNWIAMSDKNGKELLGFVDQVFTRSEDSLHLLLGTKPLDDVFSESKENK